MTPGPGASCGVPAVRLTRRRTSACASVWTDSPRSATVRPVLSRPLALVSTVLTGVLTGGMVFIEVVLLPFWRGLPPAEFRAWFASHAGRIRALMVPLGAATGIACTASASARVAGGRRGGPAAVAAAGAAAGVIAVTVTVNEPANHRFAGRTLTDDGTTELLHRWARWHHVRVVLGLAATVAAAWALVDAEDRARSRMPAGALSRLVGARPGDDRG